MEVRYPPEIAVAAVTACAAIEIVAGIVFLWLKKNGVRACFVVSASEFAGLVAMGFWEKQEGIRRRRIMRRMLGIHDVSASGEC